MNKRLKIWLLIAVIAAVLLVFSGCLSMVEEWLSKPQAIKFTAKQQEFLAEELGINLSAEGRYLEGYQYFSRDTTTLYMFEFTSPEKLDEESAEAFVCSQLGLDDRFGGASPVTDGTLFGQLVSEGGWAFTHCFSNDKGSYWTSIFYCAEEYVVRVAVVYGAP